MLAQPVNQRPREVCGRGQAIASVGETTPGILADGREWWERAGRQAGARRRARRRGRWCVDPGGAQATHTVLPGGRVAGNRRPSRQNAVAS